MIFRREIYSTGLHRSKCTGSDVCKRAHASTQTRKQTDATQLQINIHRKDCAKMFSHQKTEKSDEDEKSENEYSHIIETLLSLGEKRS